MKLAEVAAALDLPLTGDPEIEITGLAGLETAQAGHLSFLSNPKYAPLMKTTRAAAVIVGREGFEGASGALLRSENPYLSFARAVDLFYKPPRQAPGVHPTAMVHASARVGENASIGAYVVIEAGVTIGNDCVIYPHVVIYPGAKIGDRLVAHAHAVVREQCVIGNDVTLQNGCVIGGDGFGFANENGTWLKITQSGPAVLEDRVEVQSNACIDRASIGETRIRAGAKVDNLVQVGHGCEVGEDTLLCAQVGLAGSTAVGKKVILAGQVGVAGHCVIGDGVVATAQTGIPSDVGTGMVVSGYPAIENRQWLRCVAVFNRLPEIIRELRAAIRNSDRAESAS